MILDRPEKVAAFILGLTPLTPETCAAALAVLKTNQVGVLSDLVLGTFREAARRAELDEEDVVGCVRELANGGDSPLSDATSRAALEAYRREQGLDRPAPASSPKRQAADGNGHWREDVPSPDGSKEGTNAEPDVEPRAGAAEWSDPKPLPEGLLPVAPFSLDFLPASFGAWVADIAERMQCPIDYVAIPAIVAAGSVIGNKIGIRPQRRTLWTEVANCWGLIIGDPGAMKSPALAEALRHLRRLAVEARKGNEAAHKSYEEALADFELREQVAKAKRKKELEKNPDAPAPAQLVGPVEPKARRYHVEDTSYEALGVILASNPTGILAYRDELVSLLKTLDAPENATARGFYLSAWGGQESYDFDRIGRGRISIPAACLSVLGSTQPGKIREDVLRAVDGGDGDDGMIQRFGLVVWPDQRAEWQEIDRYPDSAAMDEAWATFQRLDRLDLDAASAKGFSIAYLNFDPDAQRVFSTWRRNLEARLRSDDLSAALKGHFSKYRKLAPALALINQLADYGMADVCEDALRRAISFSRYLETHARRLYAAGAQDAATPAKAILARIRRGDLLDGFTARDVKRPGWTDLTTRERVEGGLELLVGLGWLAEKDARQPGGGRPTTTYLINPKGAARNG